MRCKRGNISSEKKLYSFQVSVDHAEAMHVLQTTSNVNQLNRTSVRVCGGRGVTHKLGAVGIFVLPNELDDVPMFHPLGDHCKSAFTHCHSEQW